MTAEKKVIMIFGQRGSGKSYYAKNRLKDHSRFIVYDTLGEYSDQGVVCEDMDEFKKVLLENYRKPEMRIVFQPVRPEEDFEEICFFVYETGNLCFFVEEVGYYLGSLSMGPNLANIVQRGRHKNITLIAINQRPFGIPRLLTSQAKEIITFKQREPRDVEYLREFIGEEAEQVPDLPLYHHLRWNDGEVTVAKC